MKPVRIIRSHEPPIGVGAAGQGGSELELKALLRIVSRRRWVGIAVLIATIVLGTILTVRAPRIYQASSVLLIDHSTPDVLSDVREVYDMGSPGYWASKEYYETQYAVITSQPVADRAAQALGLSKEALRQDVQEEILARPPSVITDNIVDSLSAPLRERLAFVGITRATSNEEIELYLESASPVKAIQGRISVRPVKGSRLARIAAEDTSPQRAARIANTVAESFINYNIDQKIFVTRSAIDWLSDQAKELQEKLTRSEEALHAFKVKSNIVSVSMEDRQSMISESLSQLNRSLSELQAKRVSLESRKEQLSLANDDELDLDSIDEVITNRLVQEYKSSLTRLIQEESELSIRYTGQHPKLLTVRNKLKLVSENLRKEVGKIGRSINREHDITIKTETRLRTAIEELKKEALQINKKEIEYNRLKRERDHTTALYQVILKRQKEADLTHLLRLSNVRLLEIATVPDSPVRPRIKFNVLISMLIGVFLGIVVTFVVDYFDDSVSSQRDIEQSVGLPFLGVFPIIAEDPDGDSENPSSRDLYILNEPRSSVAECCRSLRTNIMFMSPDDPARSLVVTSSAPREGKSTTLINLAITMAQSNLKTVVVDTDLRRPRLHKTFSVDNRVGVSSFILGEMDVPGVIQPSSVDGLDVVTCGPIPPNPTELLHTERFRTFLKELEARYDRVLLDSPPVIAVTDAQILASMADGTIMVVRANETSRHSANQAKRALNNVGARILGVVLNGFDLSQSERHGYYQYQYYDQSEEDASGVG
jgi:capsular exopolysaccharide synthesis family protein